ncbi:MAG: nucleoside permease [Alistipes sp.]
MGVKFRLIVMNFLQYAVWGAWLISLGAYLGGGLHFSGLQIGSFFATMGVASLFMPAVMGIIADRWLPAQKLLGICHFISGCLLVIAASQTSYASLYSCMLLSVMFYMPTIALSNSVAYNALDLAKLDAVKHFPPIRVWGTVGFIFAMWFVDLVHIDGVQIKLTEWQLYVSALLSFVLAAYSFTLPACSIAPHVERRSWIDTFGLRAFALFKEKRMAIFFLFSMLLGAALQITNAFGDTYIQSFGQMSQYADSPIVKHSVILLSLSQMSETFCILLIPFFLRRFGIKKVMLISMFAWVLRFGFFGLGNPGSGASLLILSMVVYGVAFDFFNISGSLFVEKETSRDIRSSAQGVFMIMTNGFGAFFGSYAAGAVVDAFHWPNSWFIFAGYALVVAVTFAFVFRYKHTPEALAK